MEGETVFSQHWILKETCRSRRKSRAETETARYETFSSQRAAAVRGPDGGFQHHGQRQLHLHLPATRGDDDANTLWGSVYISLQNMLCLTWNKYQREWATFVSHISHFQPHTVCTSGWHFTVLYFTNCTDAAFLVKGILFYTIFPTDLWYYWNIWGKRCQNMHLCAKQFKKI